MKIKKCPTCRRPGFVTFRYIKKWKSNQKYAYVGHYDSKKYQKEKSEYEIGKRKSKPNGRIWHSISNYSIVMGIKEFDEKWFVTYLQIIGKIYQKYKKYGIKNIQYVLEKTNLPYYLREIRQDFIANPNWRKDWSDAAQILQENRFEKQFIQQRIFHDICLQQEREGDGHFFTDKILYSICLD